VADPIRVLIVDDHAVVREGVRAFLELQERMEVIGEAGDGREAIEEAERLDEFLTTDLLFSERVRWDSRDRLSSSTAVGRCR
jgi:CheY-like chemotaxis protein